MKTLLTLALTFCLSFSASASTGAVQGLNQLMNEYQYSLAVEWDQKDAEFKRELSKKFAAEVSSLLEQNSISREEILNLINSKVSSKQQLEALKLKVAMMPKDLTSAQIISLVQSMDAGSKGASWNGAGDVAVKTLGVLILAFMVLVIANQVQQGDCVEESTELKESCDDVSCYEYYPCLERENKSWF